MWGVGIVPSCHMQFDLCKATLARQTSVELWYRYNLDDVLTILDKHYNNMKTLDTLNHELFQLQMADKETVSDWGVCLSRHLQVLAASFPDHFLPD